MGAWHGKVHSLCRACTHGCGLGALCSPSSSRGAASLLQLYGIMSARDCDCGTPQAVQLSVSCRRVTHSILTWRKPLLPPPLHEVPGSALAQLLHAAGWQAAGGPTIGALREPVPVGKHVHARCWGHVEAAGPVAGQRRPGMSSSRGSSSSRGCSTAGHEVMRRRWALLTLQAGASTSSSTGLSQA